MAEANQDDVASFSKNPEAAARAAFLNASSKISAQVWMSWLTAGAELAVNQMSPETNYFMRFFAVQSATPKRSPDGCER